MLAVQFKRRSLVEYADVTWYQVWARTYNSERKQVKDRYHDRKPLNGELAHVSSYSMCLSFSNRTFCALRLVQVEGWESTQRNLLHGAYIDYWMDNGRMRDPISHMDVDQNMWTLLIKPIFVFAMSLLVLSTKLSIAANKLIRVK
jgi:hypothetical protein